MTRQTAIDHMCRLCLHDAYGGSGTWRQQVAACTAQQCPLFRYRPQPRYESPEQREKRLQHRVAAVEVQQEAS